MSIQEQNIDEAKKASFGVNAEVPDATGVSAPMPTGSKDQGDKSSPMQGSSAGLKTKVGMINAMAQKMGKMNKSDVTAAYEAMMTKKKKAVTEEEEVEGEEIVAEEEVTVISKTISRDDIDVQEDVKAIFQGSELSEEFQAKAAEIFETAVVSIVNEKLAQIAEQAEAEHISEMKAIEETMVSKVDEYLDYVVEQFMEENKLAIESGLRSEITENFLSGLRDLFVEHYIDIPEEKVDVVEELAARVEELEASVNEELQKNIDMKKRVEDFEREIAFVEVAEGLTETETAKLESLAEAVDFDSAEGYKHKLQTIRESYFNNKQELVESVKTLDDEPVEDVNEDTATGDMKVYSDAISRTIKK